jgi:hypothetical protein
VTEKAGRCKHNVLAKFINIFIIKLYHYCTETNREIYWMLFKWPDKWSINSQLELTIEMKLYNFINFKCKKVFYHKEDSFLPLLISVPTIFISLDVNRSSRMSDRESSHTLWEKRKRENFFFFFFFEKKIVSKTFFSAQLVWCISHLRYDTYSRKPTTLKNLEFLLKKYIIVIWRRGVTKL